MNLRATLKTVAFIFGLYFVLEYLLPAKVGGDFDNYEVLAPAYISTPEGSRLFYTGLYRKHLSAIGRLVEDPAVSTGWQRIPDTPVIQRSLFMPYDRWDMTDLDAAQLTNNLYLFYLGTGPDYSDVLCYAVSQDDGMTWDKKGPVICIKNFITQEKDPAISTTNSLGSSEKEPNGPLPGILRRFAVEHNETWHFWLLMDTRQYGRVVWEMTGDDLQGMDLASGPCVKRERIPKIVSAFDVYYTNGTAMCAIVNGNTMYTTPAQLDGSEPRAIHTFPTNDMTITGMRLGNGAGTCFYSAEITDESGKETIRETGIFSFNISSTASDIGIKYVGRPAQSTYLSLGVKWAGECMQIIGSFAIFLAVINLLIFHTKSIYRNTMEVSSARTAEPQESHRKENAQRMVKITNSVVFLIFMLLMIPLAYMGSPEEAKGTLWRQGFDFLFNSIQLPMGAAVFSMITFYLISAAYRSFRMRSTEAALLMIAALICMIGQMPIGTWLTSLVPWKFLQLPWLSQKLLLVVNSAAYRGVLIGLLIGGISISLRIWLGLDNSVYASINKK
jgi:hypothetical protein